MRVNICKGFLRLLECPMQLRTVCKFQTSSRHALERWREIPCQVLITWRWDEIWYVPPHPDILNTRWQFLASNAHTYPESQWGSPPGSPNHSGRGRDNSKPYPGAPRVIAVRANSVGTASRRRGRSRALAAEWRLVAREVNRLQTREDMSGRN